MADERATDRLRALARERAEQLHERYAPVCRAQFGRHGLGSMDTCPHPDCVLVRAASSVPESMRDEILAQANSALNRAGSRHLVGTKDGRIVSCTIEQAGLPVGTASSVPATPEPCGCEVYESCEKCRAAKADLWRPVVSPAPDGDACPRCGGSFEATGGKPISDPYICQKCAGEAQP